MVRVVILLFSLFNYWCSNFILLHFVINIVLWACRLQTTLKFEPYKLEYFVFIYKFSSNRLNDSICCVCQGWSAYSYFLMYWKCHVTYRESRVREWQVVRVRLSRALFALRVSYRCGSLPHNPRLYTHPPTPRRAVSALYIYTLAEWLKLN